MTHSVTRPCMCGNPHLVCNAWIHFEQIPYSFVYEPGTQLLKESDVLTGQPFSSGVPRRHVWSPREEADGKAVAAVVGHSWIVIPVGADPSVPQLIGLARERNPTSRPSLWPTWSEQPERKAPVVTESLGQITSPNGTGESREVRNLRQVAANHHYSRIRDWPRCVCFGVREF